MTFMKTVFSSFIERHTDIKTVSEI